MQGENVFDPVKVAEARARREERREKLRAQLGPMNPERLVREGDLLVKQGLQLENNFRPAHWIELPNTPNRALVVLAGSDRLAIVYQTTGQAELIELEWDSTASIWDYCQGFEASKLRPIPFWLTHAFDSF